MHDMLSNLIDRLNAPTLTEANVIAWGCPVPSFGNLPRSRIATIGLNPSNREFVDGSGNELDGPFRRFHTLKSLGLARWSDANTRHLRLIMDSCYAYFSRNPYNRWFRKLDYIISGTKASYYAKTAKACHLDLIPYATTCKWTDLTRIQRSSLLEISSDTLGLLLRDSQVRLLILNGRSVVEHFQYISGIHLEKEMMRNWSLPRRSKPDVAGFAYQGVVRTLAGVRLKQRVKVLGFNHNIQSSFGVTTQVTSAIRSWITQAAGEVIS